MASSLMTIVMFALSLTIYEIFDNEIKFEKFDLKNYDQGREGENHDLCHKTGNGQLNNGDFILTFSYLVTHLFAQMDGNRRSHSER